MNARLIKAWNDLQSSYYFIPGLMAIGAAFLAWFTGYLDQHFNPEIAETMGWLYSNKPDGARAILTTIAGSMMTVASVIFSITMVAVTTASGQYGPRLIGNFMRDRGNQVTLGTFTSTFVYCLLILKTARTGDGGSGENTVSEFVPNLSLLVAMGLTLASVAVMIYFIHHISETLNVGNITGRVGRQLRRDLSKLFPDDAHIGDNQSATNMVQKLDDTKSETVCAHAEGYIQAINHAALLRFAEDQNCIIKIAAKPGEFITKDRALALTWTAASDELDRECHAKVRAAFAMGQQRTAYQNTMFLSDQLVEILARALSPSVNDPFTAINCVHWFQSGLNQALQGFPVSPYKYDAAGNLRLIEPTMTFETLIDRICNQTRLYTARDPNVARAMVDMLFTLLGNAKSEADKKGIRKNIERFQESCKENLPTQTERTVIEAFIQARL